jgi:predicted AlkP superfamily pyrophosphatase or phosphodiesterase
MDLDEITHIYGVGSPEVVRTMRDTDHAVKAIVERYTEVDPDPFVMIFADHGMINVERTVAIEDILSQAGLNQTHDYLGFFDSTMARFWGSEKVLDKIAYVLGKNGSGRILTEHDRRTFHIPEARYGQLIYLIDSGTVVFPSYYARYTCPKAMHGYDPSTDGQNTIFILYHPSFSGKRLSSANLVDIAPTILDLFDVKAPNNLEGHSLLR